QAAEYVGVLAAQAVFPAQPLDQVTDGVLGVLHQVGAQRGGGEIATLVGPGLKRPGRCLELVAPGAKALTLLDVEAEAESHRALDPGHADLPVALRCVAVPGREVRAGHEDGQGEPGPDLAVARVDVSG